MIEPGRCVTPAALSADGSRVAFLDQEARCSVWDVATGVEQWSEVLEDVPAEPWPDAVVALSPDGRTLLCAVLTRITVWDLASGRPLRSPHGRFEWDRTAIGPPRETAPRFTPDGQHLLAVRTPNVIGLWRVGEPECLAERRVPKTRDLGPGLGGTSAWWLGADHRLRHWSIGSPGAIAESTVPSATKVPSVPTVSLGSAKVFPVNTGSIRISADGYVAAGLDGERLKVWQLPDVRPVVDLPAEGARSVALLVTSRESESSAWSGLFARGGARLDLFTLPSLEGALPSGPTPSSTPARSSARRSCRARQQTAAAIDSASSARFDTRIWRPGPDL